MVDFNPAITEKLNALSQGILNGHYIFSRDFDDNYLAKRFAKPDAYAHNINYQFTDNPEDLQQYYDIRRFAYKETLGVDNNFDHADNFDKSSFILIVKAGTKVVGGARLTVSTPKNPQIMPLEEDGFDLKSHFPQLDFSEIAYCEMSRLALLPEFRNNKIAEDIHQEFIDICVRDNIHVGFARTAPLHQRRERAIFSNLGYEMIIRRDIKVPHIEINKHLNMQFSCIDFTPGRKYTTLLKQRAEPALIVLNKAEEPEFA